MGINYLVLSVTEKVGGTEMTVEYPIMYPDKLVHKHVADKMTELLTAYFPKAKVKTVSAGSLATCDVAVEEGSKSTSLKIPSRPEDENMINVYNYCHGIRND